MAKVSALSETPQRISQRYSGRDQPMGSTLELPLTPPVPDGNERVEAMGNPRIEEVLPLRATEVYTTYWRFAHERQQVYLRRLRGEPPPWSDDSILTVHRFTNAYRVTDRVSQYLIRNVIYAGDQSDTQVFFRTLLFKLFNTISTWELLRREVGELVYSRDHIQRIDRVLSQAADRGDRIYSPAYIMPPVAAFGDGPKFRGHLKLLDWLITEEVPAELSEARGLEEVFSILKASPGLGDFLAFQYATDLNYSNVVDFHESDFVVAGPGARSGITKCFEDVGGLSEEEIIMAVFEVQEAEFARLGLDFATLRGRRLQPIDIQNLFCEVDKYARLAHPEVQGRGQRSRIKQKFRNEDRPLPPPWFPPKWGINSCDLSDLPEDGAGDNDHKELGQQMLVPLFG